MITGEKSGFGNISLEDFMRVIAIFVYFIVMMVSAGSYFSDFDTSNLSSMSTARNRLAAEEE